MKSVKNYLDKNYHYHRLIPTVHYQNDLDQNYHYYWLTNIYYQNYHHHWLTNIFLLNIISVIDYYHHSVKMNAPGDQIIQYNSDREFSGLPIIIKSDRDNAKMLWYWSDHTILILGDNFSTIVIKLFTSNSRDHCP